MERYKSIFRCVVCVECPPDTKGNGDDGDQDNGEVLFHRLIIAYVIIAEIKNARVFQHRASDQHNGGVDMDSLTQKELGRFWGKVSKEKSEIFYNGTRCWEWIAYKNLYGYGKIGIRCKVYLSHRISYQIAFGDFPKDLNILHKCDNTSCVNPNHLLLGTQKDNIDDMWKKGRGARFPDRKGEKAPNCKLTDKQVEEIRMRYSTGKENQTQLAKVFGVDPSQIGNIVRYKQRV